MTKNEINVLNKIEGMLQKASSLSNSGNIDDAIKIVEEAHDYYKHQTEEDNRIENIEDKITLIYDRDEEIIPDPVKLIFKTIAMVDCYQHQ